MQLFYAPDITEKPFLPDEEAYHCLKVLRHKEGDTVYIVDGKGGFYTCSIDKIHKKQVVFHILEKIENYGQKGFNVHLWIAPTKNINRMEWMVEKLTEFGIDKISFVQTARSERKYLKPERLQKIAVNAMKQSQKAFLPCLEDIRPLKDLLKGEISNDQNFFCHQDEGYNNHLFNNVKPENNYLIAVGPEGDFNKEETKLLKEKGFQPVSLGSSRLRTETAAISACNILNLVNEI